LVEEAGSDEARATVATGQHPTTSRLAYVETRAALARIASAGRLTSRSHRKAVTTFDELWTDLVVVDVDSSVVDHAATLAERHLLRAYDAVHLAAAQAIGDSRTTFCCFDRRLRAAAAAEKLTLMPAS
jgi:predicted nucleic acid-binding protein